MSIVTDAHAAEAPNEEILLPEDLHKPLPARPPISRDTLALWLIATGMVFYAMYSARAVLFPLTLAVFVALPFRPIMRWLTSLHVPRFLSAGMLMLACLALVLSGIYWLAAPASEWLEDAPSKLTKAEAKLRAISEPLQEINEATAKVEAMAEGSRSPETIKVEVQQPRLSSTVLTATGDFAIGAMIAVSLSFLLLVFGDDLTKSIIAALPTRSDRRQLEQIFFDAERTISRYLLTCTGINIGLGAVIGTGLWMIGMPNPLLWGVMAALLNYIPLLGLVAGTAVVFVVALLTFDSVAYACLAPAIYLGVNGIEANIITPTFLGRSMKLNTIAIFVAIVIFGWLWGVGGVLIAVPALALLKIAFERSPTLSPLAGVLSA